MNDGIALLICPEDDRADEPLEDGAAGPADSSTDFAAETPDMPMPVEPAILDEGCSLGEDDKGQCVEVRLTHDMAKVAPDEDRPRNFDPEGGYSMRVRDAASERSVVVNEDDLLAGKDILANARAVAASLATELNTAHQPLFLGAAIEERRQRHDEPICVTVGYRSGCSCRRC